MFLFFRRTSSRLLLLPTWGGAWHFFCRFFGGSSLTFLLLSEGPSSSSGPCVCPEPPAVEWKPLSVLLRQHGESRREKENNRGHGAKEGEGPVSSSPLLQINNPAYSPPLFPARPTDSTLGPARPVPAPNRQQNPSARRASPKNAIYIINPDIVLLSTGFGRAPRNRHTPRIG